MTEHIKIYEPLVSIVIPSYNYGHLIGSTLDSVLAQTYHNWECIIVDDGSKDNTREIVQKFTIADSRFIYILQDNQGTSAAKNTGLTNAKGEYIQFLDADDLIAERKLELQVSILERKKDIGLVYGEARYFESDNPSKQYLSFNPDDKPPIGISGKNEIILRELLRYNIMVISAPLVRKELIKKAGLFDQQLRGCEDWDLWIRCALTGAYFLFDGRADTLTFIRMHPTSASKKDRMMFEEQLKMRTKLQHNKSVPKSLHQLNTDLFLYTKGISAFILIEEGNLVKGYTKVFELIKSTNKVVYYLKNSLYWLKQYLKRKLIGNHN